MTDVISTLEENDQLTPISATSVASATEQIASGPIVCIVTASDLSDGTGLDAVNALKTESPQTPSILLPDVLPAEIDTGGFDDVVVE